MPIDYSRYPDDWKDTVERIRERSGDKCEICGLDNGSTAYSVAFYMRKAGRYSLRSVWFRDRRDAERETFNTVKPIKVVLTVAHLDHDEENHNVPDERLRHMCQICHLRYDAAEKIRRIKDKVLRRRE